MTVPKVTRNGSRRVRLGAAQPPDRTFSLPSLLRNVADRIENGQLSAPWDVEICRAVRNAGVLPPDAGFFLVVHALTQMADSRICALLESDPLFQRLDSRAEEIRRYHGLRDDEDWTAGEGPVEYRVLDDIWALLVDDRRATCMIEHGEPELAALYRADPTEFWRRYEAGRSYFFPTESQNGVMPA